jgi:hypothetical protein
MLAAWLFSSGTETLLALPNSHQIQPCVLVVNLPLGPPASRRQGEPADAGGPRPALHFPNANVIAWSSDSCAPGRASRAIFVVRQRLAQQNAQPLDGLAADRLAQTAGCAIERIRITGDQR